MQTQREVFGLASLEKSSNIPLNLGGFMTKKSLKEKLQDAMFWTSIFFILYLIVGYLLESSWLSSPLKLDDIYNLLKDGFNITAMFLAPVTAFLLFSDWREQHNKQVRNEFAIKVFNQFELFEKLIQEANIICIEMEYLVPEESRIELNDDRIPIYLSNKIFKENQDLILSFVHKIREIQECYNVLLDKIRYFGIVGSKLEEISKILLYLIAKFEEINSVDEDNDTYSEYLQLLDFNSNKLQQYFELRDEVSGLIITSLLESLRVD